MYDIDTEAWIISTSRQFARQCCQEDSMNEDIIGFMKARKAAMQDLPIVVMLDEPIHTDLRPWCDDASCPCHETDDFKKYECTCGLCGRRYWWSADDIAWQFEQSPFMPCGDPWRVLDRVLE